MICAASSSRKASETTMKSNLYSINMRCLRKLHPIFAKAIEMAEPSPYSYVVSDAKNGSSTLAIEFAGKAHQIHSKYDPEKEALQQIKGTKFQNPRLVIVFGLGLGYHIRATFKELEKQNHFLVVIEKDINALKEAIQHVDLTDLFESQKIRWAIGVPENEGFAVMNDLIKQSGIAFQLFLKTLVVFEHPAIAQIHGEYNRTMLKAFREAGQTIVFNYGNCPKDSMIGVENIMRNLSTIMRNPGIQDLYGAFKGKPGIVVSTGPSLSKNIGLLKEAQGRAVMISADSALRVLHHHGIKPHGVASLERVPGVVRLFEGIPEDYMRDIYLMGTPVIVPQAYAAWKGPTIISYRRFAHFDWIQIPKGTLDIGPSCSNMAFKILQVMGCDPIILVGQDCAVISHEKTHADGAHEQTKINLNPQELIKVRGNYQETVLTTEIFNLFRKHFVTDIAGYHGKVFNATEGGAFIEGTEITTLRQALDTACRQEFDTMKVLKNRLKIPSPDDVGKVWTNFRKIILETRTEVRAVIEFCEKGEKMVIDFEKELDEKGFSELQHFLEKFPDNRLNEVHAELSKARSKILVFGKYFNLYLMHIVQMIIVKFEMDFNELASISDNEKRCKLQAIRMMKQWFPTIGSVCKLSLQLLEEAFAGLLKEFGETDPEKSGQIS